MKYLIINISISFSTLLVIFIIIELVLYLTGYKKAVITDTGGRYLILQTSKNKELEYELKPLAKGYAWKCNVKINSWGFRDDKEYKLKKENKFRIITIGDSITFGNFLPASSTYAKQLDVFFKASYKKVEVLNMGVGGYDILQAVNMVEEKGLKFSPDVVIYGFCLNDLQYASPNLSFIKLLQLINSSWIFKFRTVQFIFEKIQKISYFAKAAGQKRYKVIDNNPKFTNLVKNDSLIKETIKKLKKCKKIRFNAYKKESRIGMMRYAFNKLNRLSKENNFKVIIAIIPLLNKKRYCVYVQNLIKNEANRHRFGVLDFQNEMSSYGFPKLQINKNDECHPNKKGHEIIAKSLYNYISKNMRIGN